MRHLGPADAERIADLDGETFGVRRPTWIAALMASGASFLGTDAAALCLRPRRGRALCLDLASARRFEDLAPVVDAALASHADRRLEGFVRDGSALAAHLRARGFAVPEFFAKIGPLVEWRKGSPTAAGAGPRVECLAWF